MTATRFDAPASSTPARRFAPPARARRGGIAFRIVRLVWLTARFARCELVSIEQYRCRFGVSKRSFHRDVAVLREAGFEIDTVAPCIYRTVCFAFDSDRA